MRTAVFLLLFFTSLATAADVSLQWDHNADADYYVVYWGLLPGDYPHRSDPVQAPTTTWAGSVDDGGTYYFAVKAFNACGNSSDFSDEVVFEAPACNPPGRVSAVGDVSGRIRITVEQLQRDGSWLPLAFQVSEPPAVATDCAFRGNPSSMIYHTPSCRYYSSGSACFSSAEAATEAGYRPCGICGLK